MRPSGRSRGRRTASGPTKDDPSSPQVDGPSEPDSPRPRSGKPRKAKEAETKAEEGFGLVALGTCPLCGSEVIEQPRSFGCRAWKQGCKFAIWKTIAGKAIGVRTAQALLKKGRTPLLRGFRSKAGNRFEARLRLDGGEVRFDFDPDDRRRPPRTPDSA